MTNDFHVGDAGRARLISARGDTAIQQVGRGLWRDELELHHGRLQFSCERESRESFYDGLRKVGRYVSWRSSTKIKS